MVWLGSVELLSVAGCRVRSDRPERGNVKLRRVMFGAKHNVVIQTGCLSRTKADVFH